MIQDAFYHKIRSRIERRFSKRPTLAILHALLFTVISVPLGLWGVISHPYSIDGVIYWTIFLWSILLFLHVGYVYLHSGAWSRRRERHIQEEVLDVGELYDFDEAEMLDLHLRLREDLQQQSNVFHRLMLNATGNLALWPGMLVGMLAFQWITRFISFDSGLFSIGFRGLLLLVLLGTFLLGFLIPVRQLWQIRGDTDEVNLRALYAYKRKRKMMPETDEVQLVEDDEERYIRLSGDERKPKRQME